MTPDRQASLCLKPSVSTSADPEVGSPPLPRGSSHATGVGSQLIPSTRALVLDAPLWAPVPSLQFQLCLQWMCDLGGAPGALSSPTVILPSQQSLMRHFSILWEGGPAGPDSSEAQRSFCLPQGPQCATPVPASSKLMCPLQSTRGRPQHHVSCLPLRRGIQAWRAEFLPTPMPGLTLGHFLFCTQSPSLRKDVPCPTKRHG